MEAAARRLAALNTQLSANNVCGLTYTPLGGEIEQDLQRLLEHDSWKERRAMKELMRDELFTP